MRPYRHAVLALCLATGPLATQAMAASGYGTIQGTTITQGGALLNGVCPILFDSKGANQIESFAATGTSGVAGFYTQANVPSGHYKLVFTNCGANTDGNPDPNYVWTFYGGTYAPGTALPVVVTKNGLTNLSPQQIPLGGTVGGTIADAKTGMGADTPVVGIIPPGGQKFVLSSGIGLGCASQQGQYSAPGALSTSIMYFAPPNWGCPNSNGVYNFGFYKPLKSGPVGVGADGMVTLDVTLKETKLCCGISGHGSTLAPGAHPVPRRR